jgi:hypothetical protein
VKLPVSFRIVAWLLVSACCTASRAAEPQAFLVGEAPLAAQLAGIDAEWNISLKATGKVRVVRAADLAYWGRYRDVEAGPQILLADGGILRADLLALDETQFVLGDATGLGRGQWEESTLHRAALAALVWQPPADASQRDRLLRELAELGGAEDRLLLVGGESLGGTLLAAPRAGRFAGENDQPGSEVFELARRGRAEPLKIPAAKVIAARFSAAELPQLPAGAMSAWLGFADGSLLRTTQIAVKGDAVRLALAAGGQLQTTLAGRKDPDKKIWDEITCLEPASPRTVWLSDRPTLGYRHIPFVSVERALGNDASVLGTRLRADSAVIRKGLGMPSASRAAYAAAGFRRFEAEVAIDAAAGLAGSVIFKVLLESDSGEWRTAYESPTVRGGEPPRAVSVDLAGASRVALLVDFAERGDACDWANWLHARLVK